MADIEDGTTRAHMDTRLTLRIDTGLLARIDEARGPVPRAAWVRRGLELALATQDALDTSHAATQALLNASKQRVQATLDEGSDW